MDNQRIDHPFNLDSQKLSKLTKEDNGAGEDGERQCNVDVALAVFRGKQFVFDNLRERLRLFNLTGHGGEKEMKKKKRNKMPVNPKYERVEKKKDSLVYRGFKSAVAFSFIPPWFNPTIHYLYM